VLGRIQIFAAAAALCVSSYAMAATTWIGTVTVSGPTTINNHEVKGTGTLFDGAVIETGTAHADMRLANNGGEITLYASSRGTLHRDYFVLERGSMKLRSSSSFNVQADNLAVAAAVNSSGTVTVEGGNTVVVEAEEGTLDVLNATGTRIAQVHSGSPLSFTSATKPSSGITTTSAVASGNSERVLPTSDANVVPSVLMLPPVSRQASSEVGGWTISPRAAGGGGCVYGAGGGCCSAKLLEQCCPNKGDNDAQCCPGMPLSPKQCGGASP